jgi:hypothetical protein
VNCLTRKIDGSDGRPIFVSLSTGRQQVTMGGGSRLLGVSWGTCPGLRLLEGLFGPWDIG